MGKKANVSKKGSSTGKPVAKPIRKWSARVANLFHQFLLIDSSCANMKKFAPLTKIQISYGIKFKKPQLQELAEFMEYRELEWHGDVNHGITVYLKNSTITINRK